MSIQLNMSKVLRIRDELKARPPFMNCADNDITENILSKYVLAVVLLDLKKEE